MKQIFIILLLLSSISYVFSEDYSYYDSEGNQIDSEGNIIKTKEEISSESSEAEFFYYDSEGNQIDSEGNIIKTEEEMSSEDEYISGNNIFYDSEGNQLDREGNIIKENAVEEGAILDYEDPNKNIDIENTTMPIDENVYETTEEKSSPFGFIGIFLVLILIIIGGIYFFTKK